MRLPRPSWALALAAGTWGAAVAGRWWGTVGAVAVVAVAAGAAAVSSRASATVAIVGLVVAAGAASGLASMARERAVLEHETVPGQVDLVVRLLDDARRGSRGWWVRAVAAPPEPGRGRSVPMLVAMEERPPVVAGEQARVTGYRSARAGRARGDPYAGVVHAEAVVPAGADPGVLWRMGNAVRARALEKLDDGGPSEALLAGFLVGDTSRVPDADLEAMRRSGLSHLVAVSGSNVALFLTLTLLALGPLSAGPRRRAAVGLVAVVVLAVATRWEPSVVRASAMAALLLAGRVGGWAPDALTTLAVTVIGVVVVSGELATDVGFTLSVLATVGVVVGAGRVPAGAPPLLAGPLAATLGAQVMVAPVLLAVFGSVPLMAPVTNLIAVPVVGVATVAGAIGVAAGVDAVVALASMGATLVLDVARAASGWPQLGWLGAGAVAGLGLAATRPLLRPPVAVAGAVATLVAMLGGGIAGPALVVLDVGQGDALLLEGADGTTILVDGGPDPAVLEEKLASYRIDRLDLVVLTHVHADHAGGLTAVFGRRPVGRFWVPGEPHATPSSLTAVAAARAAEIPMTAPPVGETVSVGEFVVEVLGPVRRYASPNDQSTVVRVSVEGGPTALLTGDVETVAQADLEGISADILKVPHQGAATSSLGWLAAVGASRAVVSVGPNDFGHPSPEVVRALEAAGAAVRRTDEEGDVVIPLGPR